MSKKLSELPVGSLVRDAQTTYNGASPVLRVLEHGHTGDPAGSTALEFRDIITLKCFDAKEPNNSNSDRKNYGNNRYLHSNILQWLNSDAAAGTWYTAQHTADQAPDSTNVWQNSGTAVNPYDTDKGFLAYLSTQLKEALLTVSKTTAKNTVTDGGGSESVSSKIFLLSTTEVGLANENNIAEGTIYSYYQQSNTNARRQKNLANDAAKGNYSSATSPWHWWLRTPYSGNSNYARCVNMDGTLNGNGAFYGFMGVAPALCVSSDLVVGDTTDSDGCYVIQWNAAPVVTPASTAWGSLNSAPALTVSVSDTDGDTYTGAAKLDGTQKTTFSGTGSGSHIIPISEWWPAMSYDEHTVTVEVEDSAGNITTNTYTFTKTNTAPAVTPASRNYGSIAQAPAITIQVSDAEGDTYTGVVKLNGTQMSTFSGAGSGSHALDMSTIWAASVVNAPNNLVVTVTDAVGAETSVNYTYTKTNSAPETPTISGLSNDIRIHASDHVQFTIGTDPEGDAQTVKLQIAADSGFTSPAEFTSVEKLVDGVWTSVENSFTNMDAGAQLRIAYSGLTDGAQVYVRVCSTDAGSGTPVYSTAYHVKVGDVLEIITKPFDQQEQPQMVTVIARMSVASGAVVQMYVCNNARDASPAWEEYEPGAEHVFTNDAKTAAGWAVGVKVRVSAGTATGEISISAIGMGVL